MPISVLLFLLLIHLFVQLLYIHLSHSLKSSLILRMALKVDSSFFVLKDLRYLATVFLHKSDLYG
jgi:hypothetical protein